MSQPESSSPDLPPKSLSDLKSKSSVIPESRLLEMTIANCDLPDSVRDLAWNFIEQSQWRGKKRSKLTHAILSYLASQLQSGAPPEALVAEWEGVVPLSVFRQWGEPSLVPIHLLSEPAQDLVIQTVRKTRLWRSEQIDVARELIAHFQDGQEAGLSTEQLIQAFGDVDTAAQLIRRAKVRNRPFVWQLLRRAVQGLGVMLAVFVFWWIWLLIRFQFAKPNITQDYIGGFDARSKAVPESERAWPLYAEGLTKLSWSPRSNATPFTPPLDADGNVLPEWQPLVKLVDVQRNGGRITRQWPVTPDGIVAPSFEKNVKREAQVDLAQFYKAIEDLGAGQNWAAIVQYAQMNEEAVRCALLGSQKPVFGFVFRDPENAAWLAHTNECTWEALEKSSRSILVGVLLPQVQQMRSFGSLLQIESERARLGGDHDRVVEIQAAQLRIAAQIYHADGFAITKLVSLVFANQSWNTIRQILDRQPDFFSVGDLKKLAAAIEDYRSKVDLRILPNSRDMLMDIMQRLYSDDGYADGQLTADGCRLLQDGSNLIRAMGLNEPGPTISAQPALFQLEGSLLSGIVASRKDFQRFIDHYCELEDAEMKTPLWESPLEGKSPAIEFMQQSTSDWTSLIRYRPLRFFQPISDMHGSYARPLLISGESAKMRSDATLVAVSLELYRREHGSWPASLEELTPEFIPTVPLDRFDGKSMKYHLVDGKPVVYSVGRNKIDDGGQLPTETKPGYECRDGDWRLWPIWKGDE